MADNLTPLAVKTKADGDVAVDVAEYGGSAVGASNAVHVQPGTAAIFTVDATGQGDVPITLNGENVTVVGPAADGVAVSGNPVRIAGKDGSGNTQDVLTDTDGHLQVDVLSGGAGTEYTEDAAAPADPSGLAVMMTRDDALSTVTEVEGDWSRLRGTAEGALWVQEYNSDAILADTASMDTNLGTVAGAVAGSEMQVDVVAALPAGDNNIGNVDIASALPAGDNNIGNVDIVSGPTGASALEIQGTAADGAAAAGDPVQIGGVDGSGNMQSLLTDTDGHLQVDVLTGGGADTPSSPSAEDITSASLAAGATTDLDSTDVGSDTLYLSGVDVWSSIPWKARIMTVANAVETVIAVIGGQAMHTVQWRPPHRKYISQGPVGAGFDGFRVEMTNLDNNDAADVYCTFWTEQ